MHLKDCCTMNMALDISLKCTSTPVSDLSKVHFFVLQFICPFYELRCKLLGCSYSYLILIQSLHNCYTS